MPRNTLQVKVGPVTVGGGAPIRVQSMVKVPTTCVQAVVKQIKTLADAGCEIVRLAVANQAAAKALSAIRKKSPLPLVADIHFIPSLARAALEAGIDKIRINPGNMVWNRELEAFFAAAAQRRVPVRLGVNSGSVAERHDARSPLSASLRKLMMFVRSAERSGFRDLVLSYKSSSVTETIDAYRFLAGHTRYPLHLGLTASGTTRTGLLKSALVLGVLLEEGIGDTVRVSLAGPAEDEVWAAWEILHALGLRKKSTPEIMACPTCGRAHLDTARVADQLEQLVGRAALPLKVAVMGCEVNGPGEAREADLGVAGYRGGATLFVAGRVKGRFPSSRVLAALVKKMRDLGKDRKEKS